MKLIQDIFFLALEPPNDGFQWFLLILIWASVLLLVFCVIMMIYEIFSSFEHSSKSEKWKKKERHKELLLKYGNKHHDNLVSVCFLARMKKYQIYEPV